MPNIDDPIEAVFAAALAAPCHPLIAEGIAYWRGIRPSPELLPGREHVDPSDMRKMLGNVGLAEIVRGPRLRLRARLLGARLTEVLGTGVVGKFLDDVIPGFDAMPVAKDYFRVAADGIPVWYRGKQTSQIGKSFLQVERLFLPLAGDGVTPDAILGIYIFGAQIR